LLVLNRPNGHTELTKTVEKKLPPRSAPSLWQPVRVSFFRNLLVAAFVSDIGTFMQRVGASWLMVSLQAGPIYVALTQTASSLPFFLLALPAGSAGDIFDRRKLVRATESWMTFVALLIAVLTVGGFMTPWVLLVLTFALSAGDAFETPTWRAVLPELVSKEDLAAASALNGIEFNGQHHPCPEVCDGQNRTGGGRVEANRRAYSRIPKLRIIE